MRETVQGQLLVSTTDCSDMHTYVGYFIVLYLYPKSSHDVLKPFGSNTFSNRGVPFELALYIIHLYTEYVTVTELTFLSGGERQVRVLLYL